jgi:hypothetical protein
MQQGKGPPSGGSFSLRPEGLEKITSGMLSDGQFSRLFAGRMLDGPGGGGYIPRTFRQAVSFYVGTARLAPRPMNLKRCPDSSCQITGFKTAETKAAAVL